MKKLDWVIEVVTKKSNHENRKTAQNSSQTKTHPIFFYWLLPFFTASSKYQWTLTYKILSPRYELFFFSRLPEHQGSKKHIWRMMNIGWRTSSLSTTPCSSSSLLPLASMAPSCFFPRLYHALRWCDQRETHIKRQAPRQDCLPSLLGDGDKLIEIVYGEEKNFFVKGRLQGRAVKAGQKYLVPSWHDEPNEPTIMKDPFHICTLSPQLPQFQQQQSP